MAEKGPPSNKEGDSKQSSSSESDGKPQEEEEKNDSKLSSSGDSKNGSEKKANGDVGAFGGAAGGVVGRSASSSPNGSRGNAASPSGEKGSGDHAAGGVRPRTVVQSVVDRTNSRLHGVVASYRRSLSPQQQQRTSPATNMKLASSNRLVRQNRSPGSPQQSRSHTSNTSNTSNANATPGNMSANAPQTRNHQLALQQQQQEDAALRDGDESDVPEAAAAIAVVNPMQEQLADLAAALEPSQDQDDVLYNWQATKKTLKERMKHMFNNELMADIIFIVGKPPSHRRIPAHKFILSTGSAVFDAMFNGAMASTAQEEEIPDVEPAAFLALLRFLYSDEVIIGPETVMTTLYTAKKYAVPALESACVDFLKQNLSSYNAFLLLTQARLFDEPQLAALCLETIDKNTTEALAAEGFTDIDLDTLRAVLERDTLGIREFKLFAAVARWADAECARQEGNPTRREVLGQALELIRFPLMSVEEFAQGAAQSGILHDREVVELFLYFTVNPKPQVMFKDTPRCCLTGKEQVVSRFIQIENRWGYSGTSDRIRFTVNRRIFVVGFGLYGSIHGPAEYSVNIQIIQTDSGKICGQNDTSFQCDGSMSTFRVMFKEPVEIQPNTNFTACSTLKGPDSYYGTKGLRKVTHESVSSGKVTFQFTYAAGNNNGTSVEDGQLPDIIFYT